MDTERRQATTHLEDHTQLELTLTLMLGRLAHTHPHQGTCLQDSIPRHPDNTLEDNIHHPMEDRTPHQPGPVYTLQVLFHLLQDQDVRLLQVMMLLLIKISLLVVLNVASRIIINSKNNGWLTTRLVLK